MVHVVAVITAKPGKRAEILGHFHGNVPAVRAPRRTWPPTARRPGS